jgi:hypothetical protein
LTGQKNKNKFLYQRLWLCQLPHSLGWQAKNFIFYSLAERDILASPNAWRRLTKLLLEAPVIYLGHAIIATLSQVSDGQTVGPSKPECSFFFLFLFKVFLFCFFWSLDRID